MDKVQLGQKRKTKEEGSKPKRDFKNDNPYMSKKKKKGGPEFEVARTDGTIKGKKIFEQKDNKAAKKAQDKKKGYSS